VIDFGPERWEKVKEAHRLWWEGRLGRPLLHITLRGRDPGRPEPDVPAHGVTACYGPEVGPEAIVDSWDYTLSCREYVGDAFPAVWPNFGAGIVAGFLGARLEVTERTVWFHPPAEREIADLRFEYDPENRWLRRVKDVCRAATERWQGSVQVAMTDLGGNLDVLSSFRPGERLLLDLYDHPDEVKRLTWEAHEMWWRYFDEINGVLRPANPGFTAWTPIFSDAPYYMLQCDFCYMIGPGMFDEFVKPELAECCRRLANPFYHLDGPGQLVHLDSLLEIEELKGVQWVPGDGQPPPEDWPEVYRRIRGAGKLVHLLGGMETLDRLAERLGSPEGIVLITEVDVSRRGEVEEFLKRYRAA
jgi:hypothetical protein